MEFKPAKCPSCGGALQLPTDQTTVNCMYCGGPVIVHEAIRDSAATSIQPQSGPASADDELKKGFIPEMTWLHWVLFAIGMFLLLMVFGMLIGK